MTTDKRSVFTDALETLGTIIGDAEKRDAIHLAVEPVTAAEKLYPGQDVGFKEGGVGVCDKPVGIVDPFLRGIVHPGQKFWLVVYPRQITSLRHVWEHPDPAFALGTIVYYSDKKTEQVFDGEDFKSKDESEQWLRNYAQELGHGITYEELMSEADCRAKNEWSYWSGPPDDNGFRYYLEDKWDENFWDHYEIVRGIKVNSGNRNKFFSCAC